MPWTDRFLDRLRPPEPGGPDPETQLAHIAALSQNARTTWFGLIGLLAFVGITLLAHRDAAFFTREATTTLPLLNVDIPVAAFFYTAPVLVAALYAYLHIYLIALWDPLAEVKPRIGADALADRAFPWLIAHMALRHRTRGRPEEEPCFEPRSMGWLIELVSLALGWLFGLVVLAGLWYRSMPVHDWRLTAVSGISLVFATLVGAASYRTMRDRMAGTGRAEAASPRSALHAWGSGLTLLVSALTLLTTGAISGPGGGTPMLLVPANLAEARLTPYPPDWKPFDLWLRDLRRAQGTGDPKQDPLIPTKEEILRWRLALARLAAPSLKGEDLRSANLENAFLPGADLRFTNLRGADLSGANLQGMNPSTADGLGFYDPTHTDLSDANLYGAQGQGAHLQNAKLRRADLRWAGLQGANLMFARMQYADLTQARLQGAIFDQSRLVGAKLASARLPGADLRSSLMIGADASSADMTGADLRTAQMQGAFMRETNLRGANCRGLILTGARVHSADLRCLDGSLVERQLKFAVGNDETTLPEPLKVWSCLDRATLGGQVLKTIEQARSYRPEAGVYFAGTPLQYTYRVFCEDGETPRKVGRWQKEEGELPSHP